ncbi:glycosyltransferase 61 family protein [Flavobacterium sp. WC2509]|uniref:glycosyltransferase 61 family protein n=1 Tax=Flavobacterium sp. WC2509 TaxID=3461406 RepID=UPI0040444E28
MENSQLIYDESLIQKKVRFTSIGYTKYLKGLKKPNPMFRVGSVLDSLSVKSWEIAPGNTTIVSKAYFLKGQLDRVTGTAYTDDPYTMMHGGYEKKHEPTRAYQFQNIWMLNGTIYKDLHQFLFHPRSQLTTRMHFFPPIVVDTEITNASIYNSYDGNAFFGLWLTDDCTMYPLAASEGVPVTSNIFTSPHMLDYESMLGMNPIRTNAAFMKNAILFDEDWGNNKSKHERFSINRNKLLSIFPGTSHPGVFILRRDSGKTRIMLNEIEIAEQLRDKYGFRIVDVTKHSVAEIISACVGAQVLVGIEGSHLMHGLMVLEPGTSVLTLQPPNRFCGVIKITTDMENINYGFVVGIPKEDSFYIDMEEVERTIELLPKTIIY